MTPTPTHCITACSPNEAKIRAVIDLDRRRWRWCDPASPEHARVIRIKTTLGLGAIECSEAFPPAIARRPDLDVAGEARLLGFDADGRIALLLAH